MPRDRPISRSLSTPGAPVSGPHVEGILPRRDERGRGHPRRSTDPREPFDPRTLGSAPRQTVRTRTATPIRAAPRPASTAPAKHLCQEVPFDAGSLMRLAVFRLGRTAHGSPASTRIEDPDLPFDRADVLLVMGLRGTVQSPQARVRKSTRRANPNLLRLRGFR